jgi:hypothetical protein
MQMMMHKAAIDLNMVGVLVKHVIVNNMNGTPVVTIGK